MKLDRRSWLQSIGELWEKIEMGGDQRLSVLYEDVNVCEVDRYGYEENIKLI